MRNLKLTHDGSSKRKSLRTGEYPIMEKKLYEWITKCRENHIPLSGNIIKGKAKEIHKKLCGGLFYASCGWFSKFKNGMESGSLKFLVKNFPHKNT